MNRRNFIKTALATGAGFTILPGAGRIWKAQRPRMIVVGDFSEDDLRALFHSIWTQPLPDGALLARFDTPKRAAMSYSSITAAIQTHQAEFGDVTALYTIT